MLSPTEADGPHGFAFRLKAHWQFKTVAMTGFTLAFFCGYFLLLKYPVFPVTMMPLTGLDRLVSFQPAALLLYISLWFYVPLAPGLIIDRRELVAYYWAMLWLALAGLTVFFFWPTSVPRPDVDWARYPAFAGLKTVDSSGNACPSLHVAFAIFSAIWLDRLLRRMGHHTWLRALSWCWCAGIFYSTLAIKQHVAIDVVAGTALGIVGAVLHGQQARNRSLTAALASAPPLQAG